MPRDVVFLFAAFTRGPLGPWARHRLIVDEGDVLGLDLAARLEQDHGMLDDVLELADVPWPGPCLEGFDRGIGEAGDLGGAAVPGPEMVEEVPGQDRDVFGPFPQRRYADGYDPETVVEVLA